MEKIVHQTSSHKMSIFLEHKNLEHYFSIRIKYKIVM